MSIAELAFFKHKSCAIETIRREERKASVGRLPYRGGMEIRRHFTEHPASVGETYGEHFKVAAGFAGSLALAAVAAAVHAVVPSRCCKTASTRIDALHEQMTTGARASNPAADTDAAGDHQPGKKRPVVAA